MADVFSRVLLLPLKYYQIDFFQPKVGYGTSRPVVILGTSIHFAIPLRAGAEFPGAVLL